MLSALSLLMEWQPTSEKLNVSSILLYCKKKNIKAALINICLGTVGQVSMCNVKSLVKNDKPTENHHTTGPLFSAILFRTY